MVPQWEETGKMRCPPRSVISAVPKHMNPMAGHDLSGHDEDGGSRMIKTETCKIDQCLPLSPGQEIPWVRQAEGHRAR